MRRIASITSMVVGGVGLAILFWVAVASAERRAVTVKVDDKSPVDYVAAQAGKAWAVVIGIDDYEKAPRLRYAVSDAKAIAGELKRQGFDVKTLLNEQATYQAIRNELGDKLVERVGERDRVVIFFAGHGETRKVKGGKEMGYLMPVNGDQAALSATSVNMNEIRDLADGLPSKHVLFLIDVCYGGVAGLQFRSLPPMTESYLKTITRERGRQLITAGGADQQAMEGPEWGHSVFTYYLLEGLGKGLADQNGDGIIPASELYGYLDDRVFRAAQLKGHTQRPELWALAAEKGEFVFLTGKEGTRDLAVRPKEVQPSTQREPEPEAEESPKPVVTKKPPRNEASPSGEQTVTFINGTQLTPAKIASLERAYGVPVQPGRFWYDRMSGLFGAEGGPTMGQIHPNLDLGGPLKRNASNGNTGVIINGRELPMQEVQYLMQLGPVLPGKYWMNSQGIGGFENGPPIFNIGAAIAAQQKRSTGMGYNRTTPGGHLGSDGNCSYFFDPSSGSSVMSGNCE